MSKSFFMIVCVLAVVLKGYNNSHTAVTQGYSERIERVPLQLHYAVGTATTD